MYYRLVCRQHENVPCHERSVGGPADITQQGIWKGSHLMVTRGETHDYLGMAINYTIPGKVKITMLDFVQGVLDECPDDLMKGASLTPAANHLFNVDPECKKLDNEKASRFHHLTAKLLYLSKHTQPDLWTAVLFLTT